MQNFTAQEISSMFPGTVSNIESPKKVFSIEPTGIEKSNIVFHTSLSEMLKITPDGFYVRGVKVPQDAAEAKAVYKAFKEFLVWAALTRN